MSSDTTDLRSINETVRRQFELAWRSGQPQPIEQYLPAADQPQYLPTLEELIFIELEMAWRKSRSAGATATVRLPRVETYLERFPCLNQPEVVRRLVRQEYRARKISGGQPEAEEYRQRFPEILSTEHLEALRTSAPGESIKLPEIPGYEVLQFLARGGMGVVFKARQIRLKRFVAIKMMIAQVFQGEEEHLRFRREAEAVARVQHPNIVQVFDVNEHDGLLYFSMEYVAGGTLADRLNGQAQEPQTAARLIAQVARGVEAAHVQNIVHRDLKPGNILLAPDQQTRLEDCTPKIADFGLAKALDEQGHTQSGTVMGTPDYMAPEQALGKSKAAGPLTDVYALGAILYEMLAGEAPYRGGTPLDTLAQVVGGNLTPLRQRRPGIPRDLEVICGKALAREPPRRYASAGALADDLERYLRREPILARPQASLLRLTRWLRRGPWLVATALALPLAIALAFFIHSRLPAPPGESASSGAIHNPVLPAIDQQQVLFSDSFDRPDAEPCDLGPVDNKLGGSGVHYYLPSFPKFGNGGPPVGAHLVSKGLENIGRDFSGVQFCKLPGACLNKNIRGEDLGQELNLRVDLKLPFDDAGHLAQAGPYINNRASAAGDGLLGGAPFDPGGGYWIRLWNDGRVDVENLRNKEIVAKADALLHFDATIWHTLEIAVQANNLQVAVDGRRLAFHQRGKTVTTVAIPADTDQDQDTAPGNRGTAGLIFACDTNRGQIGGQRATKLMVLSYKSLSNLPLVAAAGVNNDAAGAKK